MGSLVCLDSLLFVLAILPLRFLFALSLVVRHPFRALHRLQRLDLILPPLMLAVGVVGESVLSLSRLSDFIAEQSFIKLHLLFTALGIFDRLFVHYLYSSLAGLVWSLGNKRQRPTLLRLKFIICSFVFLLLQSLVITAHVMVL